MLLLFNDIVHVYQAKFHFSCPGALGEKCGASFRANMYDIS